MLTYSHKDKEVKCKQQKNMEIKIMSIYRCSICDEYKDADMHGCNECRKDNSDCNCDDCYMWSDPAFACAFCDKADHRVQYCKVTEEYYHDICLEVEKEAYGRKLYERVLEPMECARN